MTTICLMQHNTPPLHINQAVDCGLWNVVSLLQWLCEVDGYWRELEHVVVHVDSEHPKHAQRETCLVNMQAMEELGQFQFPGIVYRSLRHVGLCIIMLKHGVMAADEWHNNGPQDLVTISLCIQIVINKLQLCLLSVAYTCPYHNPTSIMGQTVQPHNPIHVVCGCEAGWAY
jgi:hypothetical protein